MIGKIRVRLTVSFLLVAVVPLMLVGSLTGYRSTANLAKQSITLQQEVVKRVELEFTSFIDQRLTELRLLDDLLGLDSLESESQQRIFDGLLTQNHHYQELSLLDSSGHEQIRRSRTRVILQEQLIDRHSEPVFTVPTHSQQIYYSAIQFDSGLREPLLEISLPIVNGRTGVTHSVLVAVLRIKAIWDILATIEIQNSIDVYILNSDDQVVAHKNPTMVLQNTQIARGSTDHRSRSLDGKEVIVVQSPVVLGKQTLHVLAMQPIASAYSLATGNALIVLATTVVAIFCAILLGVLTTHQFVKPIEKLASYTRLIGQENLTSQFEPEGQGEVRELGIAFLEMGKRLDSIISDLEQARYGATELAQVTLESIGDAVITTNDRGLVNYLNPVAEKLTGWSLADACGVQLKNVFNDTDDMLVGHQDDSTAPCLAIRKETNTPILSVFIDKVGREYTVQSSTAAIRNRDGEVLGMVVVFVDVTEAHREHQELSYQAKHDALTGLVNRREFERRLERLLVSSKEQCSEHVICFLDLDSFKRVNDTCGHDAGDELLRQVAKLFSESIRQHDTLARIGGDEFGVLLENCTCEQAKRVMRSLRNSIQKLQFNWQSQIFTIDVSIGITAVNDRVQSADVALKNADSACYEAKKSKSSHICAYIECAEESAGALAGSDIFNDNDDLVA